MAKQIKRLREVKQEELVSLDSVVIRLIEMPQGKGKVKAPAISIKGTDLEAQVEFNNHVVETTTPEGKDIYYRIRPTATSGIVIPNKEGYYSLEDSNIWVDTQPDNEGKHILRFSKGALVLRGEFKPQENNN